MIAIVSVSNSSMFAAARGGELPLLASSTDGGVTWSYKHKPIALTQNDNLLNYVGNHGVYESEPDIFVMRPGMGPVSSDANPTDNSLNYVSNSLSYGGGKIPVNLPRFDREAAYFRIGAPDRSWDVLRFNQGLGGILYSPSSLQSSQPYQNIVTRNGGYIQAMNGINWDDIPDPTRRDLRTPSVASYQLTSQPSGYAIVTLSSTLQYPLIYDYNNQDHPHGLLPVSILEGGSRGPPSMYAVKVLPGSEIYSNGDPGNMDPNNFSRTSFGDSELQNEEAQFQDNLKNAIIHHAL